MIGQALGLQTKISIALGKHNTHFSIHWDFSTIFLELMNFYFLGYQIYFLSPNFNQWRSINHLNMDVCVMYTVFELKAYLDLLKYVIL